MITCEIRCDKIYYPAPGDIPANCCRLRIISGRDNLWEPQEVVTRDVDGNQYVCPKAFMTWFRKQVTDVVRHAKDHHRVLKKQKVGETYYIFSSPLTAANHKWSITNDLPITSSC